MFSAKRRQTISHIALVAFFALLAMSSAFYNGIASGNDSVQHFQFALSVHNSINNHEIYPSFAETPNHGFGDVGLRFYPPLGYYVLAIIYIFVQDWYLAALAAFFLVFWVGGSGIYFWAREEFSPEQSVIAARDLHFRALSSESNLQQLSLFAEFSATAIIPFCFLFLTRVCRKKDKWSVLGLSVAYAVLILTHLPLTVIGSLALGAYSLLLLRKENYRQVIPKLIFAVGRGSRAQFVLLVADD